MKHIFLTLLIVCITCFSVLAQRSIVKGSETYQLIEQALQALYNTDIAATNRLAEQIRQQLPGHPVYPMLKALSLRAAHHPINPESQEFEAMRKYLYEVAHSSEAILKENKDQPEANFFALAAYGLLAMYENQDGNSMKAVNFAKSAYRSMKKGMDMEEDYPEFYFSSGIYNYYREKYPELHSVYKPFVWFFKKGDKQHGLGQLVKATQEAAFMQAEALDYLNHIYLKYEEQPKVSQRYARQLVQQYPANLYFISKYVEAALAAADYEALDSYIAKLTDSTKPYYQMLAQLFTAMLLEKQQHQWQQAEQLYAKSLETSQPLKGEGIENYRSYAYAGLARIALHRENHEEAKKRYKQSLAAAQYPQTQKEAKDYLN